jgi:hypothetical protein
MDTNNTTNTATPTVYRIGLGQCAAQPVKTLVAGDILVWNYAYQYEVISVWQKSKTMWAITERSINNGKVYTRHMKGTSLVATRGAIQAVINK